MKAVILESGLIPKTLPHLVEAAQNLKLDPLVLTLPDCAGIEALRREPEPFLFYSILDDEQGFLLETELLNLGGISFFHQPQTAFSCRNKAFQSLLFQKNGLPVPAMAMNYNINTLKEAVNQVKGFPVVAKTTSGERGIGVVRVDSQEGLVSVLELLRKQGISHFLQEFIQADFYVRAVLLGDRVIGAIRYTVPTEDFRLRGMRSMKASLINLPEAVAGDCLRAMKLLGVEFAGVDLLVRGDRFYPIEVNYPCIYLNVQALVKENISQALWRYLIFKELKSRFNA